MNTSSIPEQYRILPRLVPLSIPNSPPPKELWALAPQDCPEKDWFARFVTRVENAIRDRTFLPVLRCSDGEYRFLLGDQPPSRRLSLRYYLSSYARYVARLAKARLTGFNSQTAPGVSVGRYTSDDWRRGRERFEHGLEFVLSHGILAAHLTFCDTPFAEHFHPAFGRWLAAHSRSLSTSNFVPFYFVYGLLDKLRLPHLLGGRRVLVVHGAQGAKRERVIAALEQAGAASVAWHGISLDRSIFDQVSLTEAEKTADLAILGAGVGKFGLIESLAAFPGPVIDAGYYFEAWADPAIAAKRAFVTVVAPGKPKPVA